MGNPMLIQLLEEKCTKFVDVKRDFIQDYVVRMFHAGYDERFRHDVVRQAIARHEGMVQADRDGHRPLYCDIDWQKIERR